MAKVWGSIIASVALLGLIGCGGSSSNSGPFQQEGGASLSQYQATLPDGSVMEIEILANDALAWSGEFVVAATSGPYAFQTGSFEGTLSGDMVNATAELSNGSTFQLSGSANGDQGFKLTRSDIPGVVLNFTPVSAGSSAARGSVSFNLNANGSSARVTLSDQPYSNSNGLTEYRGTWGSAKATFWSYSTGYANIVIYVNDYAIYNVTLASYRLSDFSTVTKAASSASLSIYEPISKQVLRFGGSGTVSP